MHFGVYHHYVCIDSYDIDFVLVIILFECLVLGCFGVTITTFVRT